MTKPHRQPYVKGGVASLRQPFFLGKIAKKIKKGVKKVFKSPIGKIGALAAGAYFAPTLWGGAKGLGGWKTGIGALRNKAFGAALGNMRGAGPLHGVAKKNLLQRGWKGVKDFGLGKAALLAGGAGLTALPFLGQDEVEDEVIDDWSVTPDSISKIHQMAKNRDPSLRFLPSSDYVQSGFFTGAKDGGLIGLANGGQPAQAQAEQMLRMEYQKYRNQGGTMSYQQFKMAVLQQAQGQGPMAQGQAPMAQPQMAAHGGRIGYQGGEMVTDESMMAATPTGMMEENVEQVTGEPTREQLEALAMEIYQLRLEELDQEQLAVVYQLAMEAEPQETMMQAEDIQMAPQGAAPVMAAEGGLMSLGGMEKDYRNEGGFVALGGEERADDVPARLSKNEFVFTADAVRNAGGGDINAGAEVMENMMNHLEQGGQISEESQGQGAQRMYDTMTELETRVA